MTNNDLIELGLEYQLHSEKLRRLIRDSNDTKLLKEIALELLKLNESKTAIANWATKRAFAAEKSLK